jgi:hypothetical protein
MSILKSLGHIGIIDPNGFTVFISADDQDSGIFINVNDVVEGNPLSRFPFHYHVI